MSFTSTTQDPPLPSLKRWQDLNKRFGRKTTLRMMEYENLAKAQLTGKVLDIGGGGTAKYRDLLPKDIDYLSVNIDEEFNPTYIVQPGASLPIGEEEIDHCLSLNTLEHVYNPKFLLSEMYRTLKPGGQAHISVPWMFKIHGHPDDYSRVTPSWWNAALEETGFSSATILPLVWGRKSTASSVIGLKGIGRRIRRHMIHLEDIAYAKLLFNNKQTYSGKRGKNICSIAVGHYVVATK